MKAVAVRQPWAGLIACGEKLLEHRSWRTAHRGGLLICAGASPVSTGIVGDRFPGWRFPDDFTEKYGPYFQRGVAVCTVELDDVQGEPGRYRWVLRDPRPVEPFPVKCGPKLFRVDFGDQRAEETISKGVSVGKGGNLSLSGPDGPAPRLLVGLGWDAGYGDEEQAFDLDAGVFMLGENGKVRRDSHFVFYNNLACPFGAVEHLGDSLEGGGEGDDERVRVDLEKVPPDIHRLAIAVTIHDADRRGQSFGLLNSAFIRLAALDDGRELLRFDLMDEGGSETAMLFGELYRRGGEWKFRALGQGFSGGLAAMVKHFGLEVA